MKTIIVQDTEKEILDVLTTALELDHFKVFPAIGYEVDLLSMIGRVRPHGVMLDYLQEGSECIRICRQIKTHYPDLPVIAMSCNSNINQVYDQHGFDDYIEKPFDLDYLYLVLRKHIPKVTGRRQPMSAGQ